MKDARELEGCQYGATGTESNLRPARYKGAALPSELRRQMMVKAVGFELTTSASQARRSTTELRPDELYGRGLVVVRIVKSPARAWRRPSAIRLVRGEGVEPSSPGPKPGVLPLDDPRVRACRSRVRWWTMGGSKAV